MITIALTKNLNRKIWKAYNLGFKNGWSDAILTSMKSLKEELDHHKCIPKRRCTHCESLRVAINLIGKNI